jgi:1-acyl-sn-glycerol-3-phosphate acyltransferase
LGGELTPPKATPDELTAAENKKSVFDRRWTWNKDYKYRKPILGVGRFLFNMLVNWRIEGIEHVPTSGGVIVMINHIHALDPILPMCMLPRDITPMPKVEIFENIWTRWMVIGYGAIPVHRGAVDKQAIRSACEVLDSGGTILISPEGTRSPNRALIRAHEGMAFIASRAKTVVNILPLVLLNTDEIIPALKRFRRPTAHVRIGPAFRLNFGEGKPDLRGATDDAMRRLAVLLPDEMKGVYR